MDFKALNNRLLSNAESFLYSIFPGGVLKGNDFRIGNLQGEKGFSLSINTQTGLWYDHATGERGGDLISLYAKANNISNGDAYKKLETAPLKPTAPITPKPQPEEYEFIQPPSHDNFPSKLTKDSENLYCYESANGEPLFYVERFDQADGKKFFCPYSYDKNKGWVKKAHAKNRPLYNLPTIKDKETVIIVEGEKCANSLYSIIRASTKSTVVSWQGGAQAVNKTDWSVLENKKIIIWPDNDTQGFKAMEEIAELVSPVARSVHYLDVKEKPHKWDAYEAIQVDLINNIEKITAFINECRAEYTPPQNKNQLQIIEPPIEKIEVLDNPGALVNELRNKLGIQFKRGHEPVPVMSTSAIAKILQHKPLWGGMDLLYYDEFKNKMYTCIDFTASDMPVTDKYYHFSRDNFGSITIFLENLHPMFIKSKIKNSDMTQAIKHVLLQNTIDSLNEWGKSLKWDGEPRVETFLRDYFGCEDSLYTRQVSKNMAVMLGSRCMAPGCKIDNMIVMYGKQGTRKSTGLEALAGEFYTSSEFNYWSKDSVLNYNSGVLLNEIGEMVGVKIKDENRTKAQLSARTDRIRKPYAPDTQEIKRRYIHIGTTNRREILTDCTGNRRFWPLTTGQVDVEGIEKIRDQYFAEAIYLFKNKTPWHLIDQEALEETQVLFKDDENSSLGKALLFESEIMQLVDESKALYEGYVHILYIRRRLIFMSAENNVRALGTITMNNIADLLKHHGYEKVRKKVNSINSRGASAVWEKTHDL